MQGPHAAGAPGQQLPCRSVTRGRGPKEGASSCWRCCCPMPRAAFAWLLLLLLPVPPGPLPQAAGQWLLLACPVVALAQLAVSLHAGQPRPAHVGSAAGETQQEGQVLAAARIRLSERCWHCRPACSCHCSGSNMRVAGLPWGRAALGGGLPQKEACVAARCCRGGGAACSTSSRGSGWRCCCCCCCCSPSKLRRLRDLARPRLSRCSARRRCTSSQWLSQFTCVA